MKQINREFINVEDGGNSLPVGDDSSHECGAIVAAQAHEHHPASPKMEKPQTSAPCIYLHKWLT